MAVPKASVSPLQGAYATDYTYATDEAIAGTTRTLGASRTRPTDPYASAWRTSDQMAHRQDMRMNLGLAGLMAGGQVVGALWKTADDKHNEARLDELLKMRKGLSGSQRQQMEHLLYDPVRREAGEMQLRDEALQSSMGNTTSAGDLERIRDGKMRAMADNRRQAGVALAQAEQQAAAAQIAEIESRIHAKGERQRHVIDSITGAIAQGGALVGRVMAGRASPQIDPQPLIDRGYTPQQVNDILWHVGQVRPGQRQEVMDFYTGAAEAPAAVGESDFDLLDRVGFTKRPTPRAPLPE